MQVGLWVGIKGDLFMPLQSQYMAKTWAQRENVIFKTPRVLVKRLFVGTKKQHQNKRMKMQKTSHFKPVRAGSKTLKRGSCAPHTACGLTSAHCDTTLRFLNLPQSQGSTLMPCVCFWSECSLDFYLLYLKMCIYCPFLLFSFNLLCFRPWLYHSRCFSERVTLEAGEGPLLHLP